MSGEFYSTGYGDVLARRGWEVVGEIDTGDYQGDVFILAHKGAAWIFTATGYGSCSGCDELEDIRTYGDPAKREKALDELAERIEQQAKATGTSADVAAFLGQDRSLQDWYWHEKNWQSARDAFLGALTP